MSTLEPDLADEFDRLVPQTTASADWDAVVTKARRRQRRRGLGWLASVIALLAVGVSPAGGAIADRLSAFSDWLQGAPGTPARQSDQQAFARANERSWAGFPAGTSLRSLIRTEVGGHAFELFGFRSGDSLCLRIVARGLNGMPGLSCAPLSALREERAPVLVIQADHPFGLASKIPPGAEYVAAQAQATYGIVADGVQGVELATDDGVRKAIVASDAFLYLADKPTLGDRVRRVFAIGRDGTRAIVPFQPAPFGERNPPAQSSRQATGPSTVERVVPDGSIGWLARREHRGEAPSKGAVYLHGPLGDFEFARLLTPDPSSRVRMLIGITARRKGGGADTQDVCFFRVADGSAGGGCSQLRGVFNGIPFTWSAGSDEGGDQFTNLSGIASDDVKRMELFLATGNTEAVSLRDNAWLAQAARTDYPVRVVAYDEQDRIIGIRTIDAG